MLEKSIERFFVRQVESVGGLALKWSSPGRNGVPDRIVLLPGGRIVFVELKAPGKKPTSLQIRMHEILIGLGADVHVIDSVEDVKKFISIYTSP